MAQRIVIVSPKGGDGRTTVALHLAVALAQRRRVLLLDLDPANGTSAYLGRGRGAWRGVAEVLSGRIDLAGAIRGSNHPRLALLPAGRIAPLGQVAFERDVSRPGALQDLIADLDEMYDEIVIDVPAGLGRIARSALRVVTDALPIARTEPLAEAALPSFLLALDRVHDRENPDLEVLAVLLTVADFDDPFSCSVVEALRLGSQCAPRMHDLLIPRSLNYPSAARRGQPIERGVEGSFTEFKVFERLADYVLKRIEVRARNSEADAQPVGG